MTFDEWLEFASPRLAYGAADALMRGEASYLLRGPNGLRSLSDAERIGDAVGLLASEAGGRFLRPGIRFAGDDESTLSAAFRWLPVKSDSVFALTHAFHFTLSSLPVPEMVRRAIGQLADPVNRHHLLNPPPLPSGARNVQAALERFGDSIDRSKVTESLLLSWGREIGNDPPHRIAASVLARLNLPHWAAELTRDGRPIKPDDAPAAARNAAVNPADLPLPSLARGNAHF